MIRSRPLVLAPLPAGRMSRIGILTVTRTGDVQVEKNLANVLLGATTPVIKAAKNATETIRIVMVAILNPMRDGFVASLARPGGNITGLSPISGPEIVGKQSALLKEIVPA